MRITEMSPGIHQLSVDLKDMLFEGIWEMPNGVTLNSYVVSGDETALIDGVCGWDGVPENLFKMLGEMKVDVRSIKYLVLNHLEPDHSGWIRDLMKVHSDFEVLATDKGADIFLSYFGEDIKIRRVKDGDFLDLGQGKKLSFYTIPHVHWPDTMATYEESSGTLFSCDAFGGFGTYEKSPFDDGYTDEEIESFERDTVRYYSNIVAAFSQFVTKAVEKCSPLEIKLIAPGHGLMWRKRIGKIIEDYKNYALYQKGDARHEVTLIWGSMYGMTEKAVKAAVEELDSIGIPYHIHRVPQESWGDVLTSVWTSSGVILGMPTYEYKMFPPMASVLDEIGRKKTFGRKAFRFGSYGWSGGAQRELDELTEKYKWKWDFLPPHEFKGQPTEEDLQKVREGVRNLVASLGKEKID